MGLAPAMSGKVLISPNELCNLMKAEPVVLVDTRDPAIYAEAHIPGAVDMREVFTYLATSTPQGMTASAIHLRRPSVRRACLARNRLSSTSSP